MNSDLLNSVLVLLEEKIVSSFLPEEAKTQYDSGNIAQVHLKKYIKSIQNLSNQYLSKGSVSPKCSIEEAEGYSLYYLLINAAKVLYISNRLPENLRNTPLRILDFGSGPGTASLAFSHLFPNAHHITLVDKEVSMLECAKKLYYTSKNNLALNFLHALPSDNAEYDLIFVSNMLSENFIDQTYNLITTLIGRLSKQGSLIIIEPGSLDITRDLMKLRDAIIQKDSNVVPIFPCTHTAPCPLLKEKDQWCHGTLTWDKPKLISQLDVLLGFNKHRIKFSALILQNNGHCDGGYRLLEDPIRSKKGTQLTLCADGSITNINIPKDKGKILRGLKTWDIVSTIEDL